MKELLGHYIENALLLEILSRVIDFIITFIIVIIAWRVLVTVIRRHSHRQPDNAHRKTMCTILESVVRYTMYFIIIVQALSQLFNIHVMSLLAAAGVAGIAIAFGAQSVVKDIITGFFIIFEGMYKVGDIVTIDNFIGFVDKITLRCTTLRKYDGDLYIIPNGSIEKVLNHQKKDRDISIDVQIAYENDIDTAIEVIKACGAKAQREFPLITGDIKVLGVTSLGNHGVTIRSLVPCEGGTQFDVEREMLRRIKYAFDENGIEIPYERIVVINRDTNENKEETK